jgi:glycosyltransferase involved in cell wall biosynthesis
VKLLVLSPVYPQAPSDGDRVRLYHWLRQLATTDEVHLIAFGDPLPNGPPAKAVLVPASKWRRRFSAFVRLFSGLPVTVTSADSPAMRSAVDAAIAKAEAAGRPFDAVYAYRLKMAPYALRFRGPRFLDYTDSLTRYHERRWVAARLAGRPLRALWSRWQARKLAAYEAWCAGQFNAGFFNSRQDRDAVAAMAPAFAARLHVAANGVERKSDGRRATGGVRRGVVGKDPAVRIAFIGHLAYAPNAEAVEWFAREVLPLLRARPGLVFEVAGGDAPGRLQALAADPRVRFVGPVPDAQAFLRTARLSVCPVLTGAGRQNKLLESFAAGVPAVATPLAAEGAEARPGRDLLVGAGPEAFAAAVERLLDRPAEAARLAKSAQALLGRLYRWDRNAAALRRRLRLGRRPSLW